MTKTHPAGIPHHKRALQNMTIICAIIIATAGCRPYNQSHLPPPTVRQIEGYKKFETPAQITSQNNSDIGQYDNYESDWIPPANLEQPNRWRGIIVHHTATEKGSAEYINKLHKQRKDRNGTPWDGMGYHFLINNGNNQPNGKIETGWRWQQQREGAHCRPKEDHSKWWNNHTVGIALVGNFENTSPSQAQYESLAKLVRFLQNRYGIPADRIIGHYDVKGAATKCPGKHFSFDKLVRLLY